MSLGPRRTAPTVGANALPACTSHRPSYARASHSYTHTFSERRHALQVPQEILKPMPVHATWRGQAPLFCKGLQLAVAEGGKPPCAEMHHDSPAMCQWRCDRNRTLQPTWARGTAAAKTPDKYLNLNSAVERPSSVWFCDTSVAANFVLRNFLLVICLTVRLPQHRAPHVCEMPSRLF